MTLTWWSCQGSVALGLLLVVADVWCGTDIEEAVKQTVCVLTDVMKSLVKNSNEDKPQPIHNKIPQQIISYKLIQRLEFSIEARALHKHSQIKKHISLWRECKNC